MTGGLQLNDRRVVTLGRNYHRTELVGWRRGQVERCQAVCVGGADSGPIHRERYVGERLPGAQVSRPRHRTSRVRERIQSDLGALHPGQRRTVLPIRLITRRDSGHRLDQHDHVAGLTVQNLGEVDRRVQSGVLVTLQRDRRVRQHVPVRGVAILIVQLVEVAEVVVEVRRVRRKDAHSQLVVPHGHHRKLLRFEERIECGDHLVLLDAWQRGADLDGDFRVLSKRLSVDIGERSRDRDRVVGVRLGRAADLHRVVIDTDGQPSQFGRDLHCVSIAAVEIQHVVELDVQLAAGRALVVIGA